MTTAPAPAGPASADFAFAPVDRIRLADQGPEHFIENYLRPGIPCILEDLVHEWPAYRKWSRRYFEKELGETTARFHRLVPGSFAIDWEDGLDEARLDELLAMLDRREPVTHFGMSHPAYDFVDGHPALRGDVLPETVARLVPTRRFFGIHPMDGRFWPWLPPYRPLMFLGGPDRFTPGHYDPDLSHTFHWCVFGHKRVRLFRWDERRYAAMMRLTRRDAFEPFAADFPELAGADAWETDIPAGSTVYLPKRVWHFFRSDETSLSYVIRARSFSTLGEYLEFAFGEQSPVTVIRTQARVWRNVPPEERTRLGRWMADHEDALVDATGRAIGMIAWLVFARERARHRLRGLRRRLARLARGR